jgi:hypothetical protein
LIANHTHNHLDMQLSSTNKKSQVVTTDKIIAPYITGNVFMFRAPFGSWNGSVASYLNKEGLTKYVGSVFWDIGGQLTSSYGADWDCWGRGLSVKTCGDRYMNEVRAKGRGIVLLHDIHSKTVDMTKYIVPKLKAEGYKFIRVDSVPSVAQQIRKAGGTPGTLYTAAQPTPKPTLPTGTCLVSGSDGSMNVRTGPSTADAILGTVKNGATVQKVAVNGRWIQVSLLLNGQSVGKAGDSNPVVYIHDSGLQCN